MADPNEFERKGFEQKGDDRGLSPPAAGAEPTAEATAKAPGDLPEVESPSISPAVSEPVAIEEEKIEPKAEPEVEAARSEALQALVLVPRNNFDSEPPFEPLEAEEPRARATLKPRHWRAMRLAAAVTLAAGFGAIAGTYAIGGFKEAPPKIDVAAQEEKKAMQQSMAAMAKELTTLKASLEASNKAAQTQTANLEKRINDRVNERIAERLKKEQAEVTGSISPPQTMPAAPAYADVPTPKPAPRVAMGQGQAQRPIVRDWSVRGAHNGYVYVEGRFGDVYQVVPGAPLPGLGPVESIRRLDGRWVVTTPKGIIVSMQDRRSF